VSFARRFPIALLSLALAAALWLPAVSLLYRRDPAPYFRNDTPPPPTARRLAAYHLKLWSDPQLRSREIHKMRHSNAEWDFMGRTFLVLALANMALREPEAKAPCLEVMDRIIDETLRLEREEGLFFFLMPYARRRPFALRPPRSQFLDGEIALMLASRRMVAEKAAYKAPLAQRVGLIVARMEQSPVLCAESYPDECWTFCNTVALAAVRMADVLDGSDHSGFLRRWTETARKKLVDPHTGLLVSSFTLGGTVQDGPEGTSIWLAAHCLQLIDPELAADQYDRARKELARSVLGFGYAREWPPSWQGPMDIDSGPVVPLLEASASGLAFVGAKAFGDHTTFGRLMASLDLGGFPIERDGTLRYAAGNPVGDAVLLYAMVLGPLWDEVHNRSRQ
jgi:hypothetical protein